MVLPHCSLEEMAGSQVKVNVRHDHRSRIVREKSKTTIIKKQQLLVSDKLNLLDQSKVQILLK